MNGAIHVGLYGSGSRDAPRWTGKSSAENAMTKAS